MPPNCTSTGELVGADGLIVDHQENVKDQDAKPYGAAAVIGIDSRGA